MKETEITVQVFNTTNEINDILIKQGFKIVEKFTMDDYYFTAKADANLLSYAQLLKNSFLVREVNGESHDLKLLYKNKTLDNEGNVIAEEKTSCKINDLNSALKIFKNAGLNMWCELKQKMIVYEKGDIAFVLQIIEDLGSFIEYEEDKTMAHMDEHEKINHMLNILKSLNLKLGEDYSCKKVFMKYNKSKQKAQLSETLK